MENNFTEKAKKSIENLKNKNSKLYFLIQDTKGNARASIKFIYEMAYILKMNGYNPKILHEKNDYDGVGSWLDEKYMKEIEHVSIESKNLEVSAEDFIIVPEIFGFVMEQIKNLPCGKIVLSQSYRYMLETLQPGQSWSQLGFLKCITTSLIQKEYIQSIMKNVSVDILTPFISDFFEPRNLPQLPIIAVHTREQSDTINLIKTFYLKYPQYRWFTFRDMRGLSEKEFSEKLKESFLSVWIDDDSSFGTFPLESMSCGVPVLGVVPSLQPEWMEETNGLWVNNKNDLSNFIADYIQNWLEDNIKTDLYEEGKKTAEKYKNKQDFESNVIALFDGYIKKRAEYFESQLTKNEE